MINIHDIPKPTFNMFAFFAQLGETLLDRTPNRCSPSGTTGTSSA
jgi:hypothetical protein